MCILCPRTFVYYVVFTAWVRPYFRFRSFRLPPKVPMRAGRGFTGGEWLGCGVECSDQIGSQIAIRFNALPLCALFSPFFCGKTKEGAAGGMTS